jgi:hypothetical protein
MAASMPKLMRAETDNAQCDGSLGNISVMIDHADFSIVIKSKVPTGATGTKFLRPRWPCNIAPFGAVQIPSLLAKT